jgi:hypothetical protein
MQKVMIHKSTGDCEREQLGSSVFFVFLFAISIFLGSIANSLRGIKEVMQEPPHAHIETDKENPDDH